MHKPRCSTDAFGDPKSRQQSNTPNPPTLALSLRCASMSAGTPQAAVQDRWRALYPELRNARIDGSGWWRAHSGHPVCTEVHAGNAVVTHLGLPKVFAFFFFFQKRAEQTVSWIKPGPSLECLSNET